VGREVAKKILEWRATDGWSTPQTFTPPALPGIGSRRRRTSRRRLRAGRRCQAVRAAHALLLPAAPSPGAQQPGYADAVNEIKAIGGATSAVRTEEQTLQAQLWASVGYKDNWAGIWNQVGRFMTMRNNLSLIESGAHVRAC
jgi:hypothetical protein